MKHDRTSTTRKGRWAMIALAASLALGVPSVRAQVLMSDRPSAIKGMDVVDKRGELVPLDLPMVDEHGKATTLAAYFNQPRIIGGKPDTSKKKPVVLMMVYYRCPMLCPLVLDKFGKALSEVDFTVGKDFNAVIVSFDPRDKPADALAQKEVALAGYGRDRDDNVRNGWAYLTTTPEAARTLGDTIGFPYRYISETGEFSHGACVFIITPEGKVSRYLTGLQYPAKDVRLGLLDASDGKLASVFDYIPLFCYHFDATTGKYTLVAMRVMQVGAMASVAFIGTVLGVMWIREVRKARAKRAATGDVGGGHLAMAGGMGAVGGMGGAGAHTNQSSSVSADRAGASMGQMP